MLTASHGAAARLRILLPIMTTQRAERPAVVERHPPTRSAVCRCRLSFCRIASIVVGSKSILVFVSRHHGRISCSAHPRSVGHHPGAALSPERTCSGTGHYLFGIKGGRPKGASYPVRLSCTRALHALVVPNELARLNLKRSATENLRERAFCRGSGAVGHSDGMLAMFGS